MSFFKEINEECFHPVSVVYMRRTGPYGKDNYMLMSTFKDFLITNKLFCDETVILGIPLDNPGITEGRKCRYDVCAIGGSCGNTGIDGVKSRRLDGGRYVVFLIEHTAKAIQEAWAECFIELEKHGYLPDTGRPVIERYDKKQTDNHRCELCVPVL